MQESFDVSSTAGTYRVTVGQGLLAGVLADHPDAIYLVD
jgi:3-dehydroquinate synthase